MRLGVSLLRLDLHHLHLGRGRGRHTHGHEPDRDILGHLDN